MKKLGLILLILSAVLGCETEEPVSPTPLEPVDIVLEDTAELQHLLLGTWVAFEASGVGDGIPYPVPPEYTHTFRQDGLVDSEILKMIL